jgi:hypothetical protein
MTINAFKSGVTPLDQANMNSLLSLQDFKMLYEGTAVDSKTGSGTAENNVADYYFAIRVTSTGVTSLSRVELEIAADGAGQDLTIAVLDTDFATDGSNEGTVLKTIVVPKEFLPASAAYWYIPINLSGLSAGSNYWLKITKVGDATDHFHLIGESSADGSHPVYYRAGTTGAWSSNNAVHFKAYSGISGDVIHEVYGTNGYATYTYSGEDLDKVYFYIPPSDGAAGGVRDTLDITITSEYLDEGTVS